MFYGRMREYPVYNLSTVDDGYGFQSKKYTKSGTIKAYICRTDFTRYQSNDMDLNNCQFTGYADSQLNVGDLVDGKKVTEVVPHRYGFYFYLTTLGGSEATLDEVGGAG